MESRDELFGNILAAKLEGGKDAITGATKESEFISQDGLPLGLQRNSQSEFKFSTEGTYVVASYNYLGMKIELLNKKIICMYNISS